MIDVKVDDRDLQAGIRDVAKAAELLPRVFKRLVGDMRRDQQEHAQKEEGPDGTRWPARTSQATPKLFAKAKRKTKTQPARFEIVKYGGLLGALPDMIQVRSLGLSVWARHPVAWATAHADGGVVGRGSRLPARPFLYVSQGLADRAVEMINDALHGAWTKRKGAKP